MEQAIKKPNRVYPYLLNIGEEYHVVIENKSVIRAQRSCEGLLNLFSCLYTFNIKYSPSFEPSFLFIQSEVLNQKDSFTRGSKSLGIFLKLIANQSESEPESGNDSTSDDLSDED